MDLIRLKVERANKHFNDFKAAINVGVGAKRPTYAQGIQLQDDWTLHYSTDLPAPGSEEGLMLGDAIHQLRTSLDHLIHALVAREGRSISDKFTPLFPIHKDLIDFCANHQVSSGRLRCLVGAEPFKAIEESQPYKRDPLQPAAHPLYVLGQLDNIDKHRIILVLDQRLNFSGHIEKDGTITSFHNRTQPVKAGTQVLDFGRSLPNPPFGVQVDEMSPSIVIQDTNGVCDGKRIVALFRDMRSAVNETLDRFEAFF